MEVSIDIPDLPKVYKRLESIPGGATTALRFAIIHALRGARTYAAKSAQSRYNAPYSWLLKAIGIPRVSGLSGELKVSGAKAYLGMFPTKEIYPYGTATTELKDSYPINLLHAFMRSGVVYERASADTKRYPIMRMAGLSAPQMIGQRTDVYPKLKGLMQKDLSDELERLIPYVLRGEISPR